MRRSRCTLRPALLCILLATLPGAAHAAPMSVDDLLAVKWIRDPVISPDARRVVCVVATADRKTNKRSASLYVVNSDGQGLRRLTRPSSGSDSAPAFAPDGRRVAFVSSRGGEPQIWTIALDGGEARQLTRLSTSASGPLLFSADGKLIAFSSSVYPDCKDDACNKQKLAVQKKSLVKARVFDSLMIRHWNEWLDERRTHVFVTPASGEGAPRDLTPGPHYAPPVALGGRVDYSFSPDGKHLAYTTNTDTFLATSTNDDVYEVAVTGGRPRRLSDSPGTDNSPRYSPDGRLLAYLSMERAGYEADRPRIMVRDRKSGRTVQWAPTQDGHPLELVWSADSKTLYFTSPHHGFIELYAATAAATPRQVGQKLYAKYPSLTSDGRLLLTQEAANQPPEVALLDVKTGRLKPLTALNTWLARKAGWLPAEHHWFKGAAGDRVHAVLIKPPGFRKGRRYPALVMIHGGPQGMTGDDFHPRWNLQMFASRGYVVFGLNFHGSMGFGQKFQDSIRGDWGGKPYEDVLKGTEYLARLPFVEGRKVCAAGASYGGYMTNWIATQTRRFSCLITHAGLFNMESKYGSTEELWFPEWDWIGTPWTNRALYRRFSPHSHAEKIRTPTLVIHGQLDYRVPVEQGFQMFTALQQQKVASRLLYFPDEDHFVQKPQNIHLWWSTMWDWLGRYLR